MSRAKVLAAEIPMMAAGTRAPMAIAPKAIPANQCGNWLLNSTGTIVVVSGALAVPPTGLTCAASAM